jgi:hypothetical protein
MSQNSVVEGTVINLYVFDSAGIHEKLAKKYNALVRFRNKKTILENGCLNAEIECIRYVRKAIEKSFWDTRDSIEIVTKNYGTFTTSKPEEIKIDRKYNTIEFGNYFNILDCN